MRTVFCAPISVETTAANLRAYRLGYNAFADCFAKITRNPYRGDDPRMRAFSDGYIDAQFDLSDANAHYKRTGHYVRLAGYAGD